MNCDSCCGVLHCEPKNKTSTDTKCCCTNCGKCVVLNTDETFYETLETIQEANAE